MATTKNAIFKRFNGVDWDIINFTPSPHTHGNITNDGKLTTPNSELLTDSNGSITSNPYVKTIIKTFNTGGSGSHIVELFRFYGNSRNNFIVNIEIFTLLDTSSNKANKICCRVLDSKIRLNFYEDYFDVYEKEVQGVKEYIVVRKYIPYGTVYVKYEYIDYSYTKTLSFEHAGISVDSQYTQSDSSNYINESPIRKDILKNAKIKFSYQAIEIGDVLSTGKAPMTITTKDSSRIEMRNSIGNCTIYQTYGVTFIDQNSNRDISFPYNSYGTIALTKDIEDAISSNVRIYKIKVIDLIAQGSSINTIPFTGEDAATVVLSNGMHLNFVCTQDSSEIGGDGTGIGISIDEYTDAGGGIWFALLDSDDNQIMNSTHALYDDPTLENIIEHGDEDYRIEVYGCTDVTDYNVSNNGGVFDVDHLYPDAQLLATIKIQGGNWVIES